MGCLAVVAVVLVAIVGLGKLEGGKGGGSDAPACDDDYLAYEMAKKFVADRLRAPSTAKFPGLSAHGVGLRRLPGCGYQITGYVDAQNGFGAMIRTPFLVELTELAGKEWRAELVSLQR